MSVSPGSGKNTRAGQMKVSHLKLKGLGARRASQTGKHYDDGAPLACSAPLPKKETLRRDRSRNASDPIAGVDRLSSPSTRSWGTVSPWLAHTPEQANVAKRKRPYGAKANLMADQDALTKRAEKSTSVPKVGIPVPESAAGVTSNARKKPILLTAPQIASRSMKRFHSRHSGRNAS